MGWIRFLFQWEGRIRGGQLLVWSFAVGILSTLASMALVMAFIPRDPVLGGWPGDSKFWLVWSMGQLPSWVATASLMARRLHDLGRSAAWLIPFFAYGAIVGFVGLTWPGINNTWVAFVIISPALIAVLWLVGAPGDRHDNRYGPVPTT